MLGQISPYEEPNVTKITKPVDHSIDIMFVIMNVCLQWTMSAANCCIENGINKKAINNKISDERPVINIVSFTICTDYWPIVDLCTFKSESCRWNNHKNTSRRMIHAITRSRSDFESKQVPIFFISFFDFPCLARNFSMLRFVSAGLIEYQVI